MTAPTRRSYLAVLTLSERQHWLHVLPKSHLGLKKTRGRVQIDQRLPVTVMIQKQGRANRITVADVTVIGCAVDETSTLVNGHAL